MSDSSNLHPVRPSKSKSVKSSSSYAHGHGGIMQPPMMTHSMSLGSLGGTGVGSAASAAYGYPTNAAGGDDHTERSDDSSRPPRIDLTSVREALDAVLNRISSTARADYYRTLDQFLRAQLSKSESDYLIIKLLGAANIHYHNALIIGIIHNANSDELPSEKSGGLHDDKHNDKADKADGGKLNDKSDSANNSSNNLHGKSLSKKDRKRLEREKIKENDRKRRDAKKAKKMFQATNASASGLSVKTSIDSSDESSSDDSEFAEENNLIIVNNAIDEMNNPQNIINNIPTNAAQLDPTTLHIPTNYVTRWDQWKRLLERTGRQAEYNGILDYKIRQQSASQTALSKFIKSKYKVINNNNTNNETNNNNMMNGLLSTVHSSSASSGLLSSDHSVAILTSDTSMDNVDYHPRADEDIGDVNSLFDRTVPTVNDIRRQIMFASAAESVHYVERGVEQIVHDAMQTHLQRLITSFAHFNETRHTLDKTRTPQSQARRRLVDAASVTPMQLSPQIKPLKPSAFSSAATASLFAPREALVKKESVESVNPSAENEAATALSVTADASMDTMPPLSPVPRTHTPALASTPTPPSPQPTTPTLASLLPPLPSHQRNAYRISPTQTAISSRHAHYAATNTPFTHPHTMSRHLSSVNEDVSSSNSLQVFSLSDLIFAVECKAYRGRIAEDIEIMMQQMIIAM